MTNYDEVILQSIAQNDDLGDFFTRLEDVNDDVKEDDALLINKRTQGLLTQEEANHYGTLEDLLEENVEGLENVQRAALDGRNEVKVTQQMIDRLGDDLNRVERELRQQGMDLGHDDANPKYIDFSSLENITRYLGGGMKNIGAGAKKIALPPAKKTGETVDENRRKVLAGAAGLVAADYFNVLHDDKNCGDAIYRTKETGWDIDLWGNGEQGPCSADNRNGGGQNGTDGDNDPTTPDTTVSSYGDDVQTFTYEGNLAIADEEFGGHEELLEEYSDPALNEMLSEDYTEGDVFVTENDRVYAGGGEAYVIIDSIWEDVQDGEVDRQ